ncbi:hypothetical protein LHYA1_G004430 [Lachnellula hyalina]|uniref:Ankyrin n=1 Tax=Lachnellula hyalina TaxID=1316788 RepID=A0A8H8R380_9HELO|nr:uncharacterized protein LHYA1_G004430 [Lachnellula hyalina]TVY26841.1 hypothetical protein LHYA1_G004430 [Lachnellula hyalina]
MADDTDMLSRQQQVRQQEMMKAHRKQRQMMAWATHQQQQAINMGSSLSSTMPSSKMAQAYDDLPIMEPNDIIFVPDSAASQASREAFESACQHGPLSTVQSIVSTESHRSAPIKTPTPSFLHHGLIIALTAGNIEVARYLLSAGAPIVRQTPTTILSAPPDQQILLFELLMHHGWTPNTPGYYGAVLLPEIVTNLSLLRWFLAHGANPNLGTQRDFRDRNGASQTDSCAALEAAAGRCDVETVRMLLDAGAEIQNGVPLHFAAGVCPDSKNPHVGAVTPSREFDVGRIPVMALLVERGANVNQAEESRHMVARYAIVHAVMAGAVERVGWLLGMGADPEARGAWGSAVEYAKLRSEEMKRVVEEGVVARRWVEDVADADPT